MIKKVVTFDEFRDEFLEKLAEAKKIAIADPSSDKAKRYHHKIARLFNERKPDNFAEITKEHLTPKRVWEKHVIGILTIQQKSSDDTVSNAAKLLSYCDCKEGIKSYKPGEEAEFFKTNNKLKNIRFADKKAEALAFNLKYFIKRETEIRKAREVANCCYDKKRQRATPGNRKGNGLLSSAFTHGGPKDCSKCLTVVRVKPPYNPYRQQSLRYFGR